jgi:hypothetical protein
MLERGRAAELSAIHAGYALVSPTIGVYTVILLLLLFRSGLLSGVATGATMNLLGALSTWAGDSLHANEALALSVSDPCVAERFGAARGSSSLADALYVRYSVCNEVDGALRGEDIAAV